VVPVKKGVMRIVLRVFTMKKRGVDVGGGDDQRAGRRTFRGNKRNDSGKNFTSGKKGKNAGP